MFDTILAFIASLALSISAIFTDEPQVTETTLDVAAEVSRVEVGTDVKDIGSAKIELKTEIKIDEQTSAEAVIGYKFEHDLDTDKSTTTPYIGLQYGTEQDNHEYRVGTYLQEGGPFIGLNAGYDVVENESLGITPGIGASYSNTDGLDVGPNIEFVGKARGLRVSATNLALVERHGDKMQYRKRYSLNPINIILAGATGQRTALHVIGDILTEPQEERQPREVCKTYNFNGGKTVCTME